MLDRDDTNTEAVQGTALDAVIVQSIIREWREGRNPRIVLGSTGHPLLLATGRPLSPSQVKDLLIETRIVGGRNTVLVGDLFEAADDFIQRAVDRPNLKAAAIKKARDARKPKTPAPTAGDPPRRRGRPAAGAGA